MFTENLANAIVSRLEALPAQVERMPNRPDPKLFTHPKAAIWVGYNGSQYKDPEAADHPVQLRILRFDIGLLLRNLNRPTGAGDYIDDIRTLLHGWRPPDGGSPMRMFEDEYIDNKNGVWRYDIIVETTVPAVPSIDPDPPHGTLATYEFDEEEFEP